MKKIRYGIEGCDAKLFIVCPTLKMLLDNHRNPKEVACKAHMEYSNFIKSCKLERDMLISTYIKCLNAYDRDLVLLALPKGMVEDTISPDKNNGDWFYTITQNDFIQIIRHLYPNNQEALISKMEEFLLKITNEGDDLKPILISLYKSLGKALKINETE